MVEAQLISFVARCSLAGHALSLTIRGGFDPSSSLEDESDEPGIFWSSDRFHQSGEGSDRPYMPE